MTDSGYRHYYSDSDFRCSFCGGPYSDYCCDAAEVPDWLDEED